MSQLIAPFALLLALLPLIAYLLVFSAIRLSGRALVTTGFRDIGALAIAISGLLAVGPAELFFPEAAATVFGPKIWLAIIVFYALIVVLVAMTSQPKIVVYGRTPSELFEPLLAAARVMDAGATGDAELLQVVMPAHNVRLRLDGQRLSDYAQILAFEPNVSLEFWRQLMNELRREVERCKVQVPRRGFAMLAAAVLLAALLAWQSFGNQALVVEGFKDWLWR